MDEKKFQTLKRICDKFSFSEAKIRTNLKYVTATGIFRENLGQRDGVKWMFCLKCKSFDKCNSWY